MQKALRDHLHSVLISRQSTSEARYVAFRLKEVAARGDLAGLPMNLELFDMLPIPRQCPALKEPFVTDGGINRAQPQVDRLVPARGYVVGNVCWLSMLANAIKSNFTIEDLENQYNLRAGTWFRLEHELQSIPQVPSLTNIRKNISKRMERADQSGMEIQGIIDYMRQPPLHFSLWRRLHDLGALDLDLYYAQVANGEC